MSKNTFECPSCNKGIDTYLLKPGQESECPHCHRGFIAPSIRSGERQRFSKPTTNN